MFQTAYSSRKEMAQNIANIEQEFRAFLDRLEAIRSIMLRILRAFGNRRHQLAAAPAHFEGRLLVRLQFSNVLLTLTLKTE